MDVFWRQGAAGTTVGDLTAATGLSASSLYNVHGSKDAWLAASIALYLDALLAHMLGPMRDGTRGVDDILEFVGRLEFTGVEGDGRGCLAVSTIAELRDPPPPVAEQLDRYRAGLHEAVGAAVGRARRLGELDAEGAQRLGPQVEAFALAFNLLAASGAGPDECRALADTMRAALRERRAVTS